MLSQHRFYFVTWNVATKNPSQDLNALLDFPSQFDKNKPLPDFYVIGLQEVKSQPQNMIMDNLFIDPWSSAFNAILCRRNFFMAKNIRLQGMLLLVYTQMKHLTHLREIEAQYTKTGLGGMWGNKGAVSVRFNIYGCSVCLLNCHLTAHEHLLADRINDYNTIIKQHTYHVKETTNILYHDYVFWFGDLNFRTDHPSGSSPTSEEIVAALQKIEKDKYTSLLKHDQLIAVMKADEAFSEFTEPDIQFPPTYKFMTGTDEYDLKRKPSWTDRILNKVIANNYENLTLRADLISYHHIPHYTVSDHKPVVAQYNIKAFANYTEKTVEFAPISRIWYIGDADFRTQCTLSHDVEINPSDWIGIYDADFHNLDDYIVYEYLAKLSLPHAHSTAGQPRTITLSFPVGSGVRTPGFYRFIYFSQPNNDVRSVLGISEPFEVSSKEDKLVSLDNSEPSPSTSSPAQPGANTNNSDIFTDFTGLDVAKLSRHFANDLNID
ncbi:inositol polyphosphate 5-phosphatase K-like isoform X3 [Achroia grisella]|uniref:inositol polyphosphate 5-phosphatase K-like isoform X3 n=1 Tax=Achroia grisella TaxID=688607 RepID=UPI0027D29573|nr:inositol polyphosphate 5-phosphatase K-like isoform X3 [Achroia grisella]